MREKLWEGRGFGWEDIDSKMTSITAMFGFDLTARAGDATATGEETEGHTILCGDVIVYLIEPVTHVLDGNSIIAKEVEVDNVWMVEVCALTHKVGQINTTKQIRRNGEEADLVEFILWGSHGRPTIQQESHTARGNEIEKGVQIEDGNGSAEGGGNEAGPVSGSILNPLTPKGGGDTHESSWGVVRRDPREREL
jgi:hypothetical protein